MSTEYDPAASRSWETLASAPHWRTKRNIQYTNPPSAANALQTLNLYRFGLDREATRKPRIWAVYIHGGAWRDPLVTSCAVEAALLYITPHSTSFYSLAGVASLSYTLSPHPSHPNPSHDPSREGVHPQHLRDVVSGLHWLQTNVFAEGTKYVLLGHSCGATLALQSVYGLDLLGGIDSATSVPTLKPPEAIVGIAGLYNLPAMLRWPGDGYEDLVPVYREILEGAFQTDKVWQKASPTELDLKEETGKKPTLVVLAHSPQDQLVSENQRQEMVVVFEEAGWSDNTDKKMLLLEEIPGKHDDIWKGGKGLARLLTKTLEMMTELRKEDPTKGWSDFA